MKDLLSTLRFRSFSQNDLSAVENPSDPKEVREQEYNTLQEELCVQKRLNSELQRRCSELSNSVWTMEMALKQKGELHSPEMSVIQVNVENDKPEEWQFLMETVRKTLDENVELVKLLKRYQKLLESYRSYELKILTDPPLNQVEDIKITEIIPEDQSKILNWDRRPSGSSSFLYAGVEPHIQAPPPTPTRKVIDAKVEVSFESSTVTLPSLTMSTIGTWLYKYPRKQYNKLINQAVLPLSQLSYRLFWVQPLRMSICWSTDVNSTELKQVQFLDFYTEDRLVSGGSEEKPVTIIVILTEQEHPLTLVPTNNEDLLTWINGLRTLMKLRNNGSWPNNLRICLMDQSHPSTNPLHNL